MKRVVFMILTAKFNGKEADYLKFGTGSKPLVILPGLSLPNVLRSAQAIESAYSVFTKEYTVYLFDRIKFPPDNYTLTEMAEDTAQSIKSAGIENACLFGASQGGMLALLVAAMHPELVAKLVAGSTAARSSDGLYRVIHRWVNLAEEKNIPDLAGDIAQKVFSPSTLKTAQDFIVAFNSDVTAEEVEKFAVLAKACLDFDFRAELKKITCPVLIIGCEGDAVMSDRRSSPAIADEIGTADLYMFDSRYGHAVYDEAPGYKKMLLDFFSR